MTPSTPDRPVDMSVEDFEELARHAPEGVKLELIKGKLKVKPLPDQLHKAIVMWLLRVCLQQRPALALYPEQELKVDTYRKGRAIADAALAPLDHFVAEPEMWGDPEGVLMVVEVTSHGPRALARDRIEKRDGYAASDIPLYLLVDRDAGSVVVFSEPRHGVYQHRAAYPFGATIPLPSPVDITLDTEKLKEYVD
ncbi:Uma2 family endonuclease [Streptomyces sp. ISL-36]|uniref:Uma2 family endonuclease n=1 Tax=Streptomyces sp. ISL-36 TaxID=2819182 RepID=UPI001BE9CB5A|nr:Uma2 family endonuclease [Streptomyces sp. ISL-36]MBT2439673.1 Uma2 family endonuclease [Streptomyces sp. ISL-36]